MKKQILILSSIFLASQAFSQVVLSENFDNGLPATWSQTTLSSDGGWKNGTVATLSSQSFPIPNLNGTKAMATNDDACGSGCNKSADRIISPSMDFSVGTSFKVAFDLFYLKGTYQSKTEKATVEVSTDGGTNWTVVKTLTGAEEWRVEEVNLSSYAGQSDVKVSIVYNDGPGGWLFGCVIDNFLVFQPAPNDAKLVSVSLNRYSFANINNVLSFKVNNYGSIPITSIDVSWNDGSAHTATFNTNIAVGATVTINHTVPVNYSTVNTYDIDVEITAVNGGVDPNPADNTGSTVISTISQNASKKVLIEEGTGTWCGWCPRGAVAMDYMTVNYPDDFIGVAVHNGDPMADATYNNSSKFDGFPSSHTDRFILNADVGISDFENYYNQRINVLTPATVSITATSNGNAVAIVTSATFYTAYSDSRYNLGVIIAEDNVTGTSSGYNQSNYYAGGSNGVMGGYESLPGTVPAAQMVYDHVGRALLGGYAGQTGSIPATITDGQTVNYTFNYNIPATSNKNEMYAVVVIIDSQTGEIVNSNKVGFATASVGDVQTIDLAVYPNPASEKLNVTFEAQGDDYLIQVTDLQGRVVLSESHSNLSGSQNLEVNTSNLSSGNYLLSVAQSGASFTKMISIK